MADKDLKNIIPSIIEEQIKKSKPTETDNPDKIPGEQSQVEAMTRQIMSIIAGRAPISSLFQHAVQGISSAGEVIGALAKNQIFGQDGFGIHNKGYEGRHLHKGSNSNWKGSSSGVNESGERGSERKEPPSYTPSKPISTGMTSYYGAGGIQGGAGGPSGPADLRHPLPHGPGTPQETGYNGKFKGFSNEVNDAINKVAADHKLNPRAIASVIQLESSWQTKNKTGSYHGLTQIGKATFNEAGGTLAGKTWDQFLNASPADQIKVYGAWLDHYKFNKQMNTHNIDLNKMSPERQYALLQGFQFAPAGGANWKKALGRGQTNIPTAPIIRGQRAKQAGALGSTSIGDMERYGKKSLIPRFPYEDGKFTKPAEGDAKPLTKGPVIAPRESIGGGQRLENAGGGVTSYFGPEKLEAAKEKPAQQISSEYAGRNVPLPDQQNRPYHTGGTITGLEHNYIYGSGGAKRGSAPYGDWNIWTTKHMYKNEQTVGIGERGNIMRDPKYPGNPRTGILIHPSNHGTTVNNILTEGCLGIPRKYWGQFHKDLEDKVAKDGPQVISIHRDGSADIHNYVAGEKIQTENEFIEQNKGKGGKLTPDAEKKLEDAKPKSVEEKKEIPPILRAREKSLVPTQAEAQTKTSASILTQTKEEAKAQQPKKQQTQAPTIENAKRLREQQAQAEKPTIENAKRLREQQQAQAQTQVQIKPPVNILTQTKEETKVQGSKESKPEPIRREEKKATEPPKSQPTQPYKAMKSPVQQDLKMPPVGKNHDRLMPGLSGPRGGGSFHQPISPNTNIIQKNAISDQVRKQTPSNTEAPQNQKPTPKAASNASTGTRYVPHGLENWAKTHTGPSTAGQSGVHTTFTQNRSRSNDKFNNNQPQAN
jgi:hypothetical protein